MLITADAVNDRSQNSSTSISSGILTFHEMLKISHATSQAVTFSSLLAACAKAREIKCAEHVCHGEVVGENTGEFRGSRSSGAAAMKF